jgi:hypothetical protein
VTCCTIQSVHSSLKKFLQEKVINLLLDNNEYNWVSIGHALYIINNNKKQGMTFETHYWV